MNFLQIISKSDLHSLILYNKNITKMGQANPTSIFDKRLQNELRIYTRDVFEAISYELNADVGFLIDKLTTDQTVYEPGNTCCAFLNTKNKKIKRLCHNTTNGKNKKYCLQHDDRNHVEDEQKYVKKLLQYIIINNKEYYFDASTLKVYNFKGIKNQSPECIGMYDVNSSSIICI